MAQDLFHNLRPRRLGRCLAAWCCLGALLWSAAVGVAAAGGAEEGSPPAGYRVYKERGGGYEFLYPADYSVKDISGALLLRGGESQWMMEVKEIRHYPRAEFDPQTMSWADFAQRTARLMCDADGPDGSRSCPEVASGTVIDEGGPLAIAVFTFRELIVRYGSGGPTTTRRLKGPVYAVRLSGPDEPYRVLLVLPWTDAPVAPASREAVGRLVRSIRLLER